MQTTKKDRLTPKETKAINKEIHKLLEPIHFDIIPLSDIFDILERHGVQVLQEDQTPWSGLLLGGVDNTEQVYFDLAKDQETFEGRYIHMIGNCCLTLSYYKMQSGRYEVLAYIA